MGLRANRRIASRVALAALLAALTLAFASGFSAPVALAQSSGTSFGENHPVLAGLDFAITVSRLFILLTVVASFAYICYGSILLMAAEGEARKLDRARGVLLRTVVGLTASVCSYLIVSGAILLGVGVIGLPEVVTFWDAAVFEDEFGFHKLLPDNGENIALEGEVIMLNGDSPVVCGPDVDSVTDNKWLYKTNLTGATPAPIPGSALSQINGCERQ